MLVNAQIYYKNVKNIFDRSGFNGSEVKLKRLNVEHRTSNIEHSILMALRFIYFKTSEPHIFEG